MIDLRKGDFNQLYAKLPHQGFDLILTDPPYGALGNLHDWDKIPDWNILEQVFHDLLAPFGQVIIFADIHSLATIKTVFGNSLVYRTHHIWKKPGGMPANQITPIILDAEFILVFRRKVDKVSSLAFNSSALGGKGLPYQKTSVASHIKTRSSKRSLTVNTTGDRWARTILEAPAKPNMVKAERTSHPTQKPLALIRKLITGYSNPGASILDPFAGSGTTLVGAHLENRNAVGFELNPEYFFEAQSRITRTLSQQDVFGTVPS